MFHITPKLKQKSSTDVALQHSKPVAKHPLKPLPVTGSKKKIPLLSRFTIGAERDYVLENLYTLMAAGMTITIALQSISAEIHSAYLKGLLKTVQDEIDGGSTLWVALDHTGLFSEHVIALIRIGEESGRLSENLKVISVYEQKENEFRSRFSSALIYPVFVFALTFIVGIGIAWFSLPKLSTVFSQLKINLPLPTKILIGFGTFLGNYGFIAVPISIVLLFVAIYIAFIHPSTKHVGQRILFAIPIFKKLIQQVELTRLGYIMGNLLDAGLPVGTALESLARSTDYLVYKDLYAHIYESVVDGNSFQKSLLGYKKCSQLIPIPVQQMIISGEQAGKLSNMFLKIGDIYESKSETYMKNLPVILEPILLVIVWLGVVGVAIAVILPLYSLIGNLNNGR